MLHACCDVAALVIHVDKGCPVASGIRHVPSQNPRRYPSPEYFVAAWPRLRASGAHSRRPYSTASHWPLLAVVGCRSCSLKRRGKDVDRIQDEIRAAAEGRPVTYADEDAPGHGHFYCVPCARHFISAEVLAAHEKTKPHKKQLKVVAEAQYTQREADAGAGMSAPDTVRS